MNKKGIFGFSTELVVYLFFIIIVAVFIFSVAVDYLSSKTETIQLESYILTKSITNSKTCLAYDDGLRTYKGVIDLKKLNFEVLNKCFSKPTIGYLVKIQDLEGKEVKVASKLDARQKAYLPICKDLKSYECYSRKTIVSYYQENEVKTGYLTIDLIKQKGGFSLV
ncbi:hypothetical protein J4216_06675 [Candidatus Woesearchaeota archaeon]|nr:hypothetical protein [Candidatus Woesearchaeota archaeon]